MQRIPNITLGAWMSAALAVASACLPAQQSHYAVALNGIDAYGTAAGVGDLVTNSTWEAWVKIPANPVTPASYRPVLFRWGMYSHGLDINVSTGQAQVNTYSCPASCPAGQSANGVLAADTWHHVAEVYGPEGGPSCTVYVDGVQVASCAALGCNPYAGWQTVLGAVGYIGYSSFLHATVDEARISSTPRYSASFIPQRRFVADAQTVGLWHFDEGNGAIAHDSSGNGRDFTLYGGYQWVQGNLTQDAEWHMFGSGCAGSAGTATLDAVDDAIPTLGTTFHMQLTNLPATPISVPFVYLGYSNQWPDGTPLALPMDVYGMPAACTQYVDPTNGYIFALVNGWGTANWDVVIPPSPLLDGATVYVQGIVLDWQLTTPLPALSTNAGEMVMRF